MAKKKNPTSFPTASIAVLVIIAVLAVFAFAFRPQSSQTSTVRVDLGLSKCGPSFLPLLVASDRGLFGKHGIQLAVHDSYDNASIDPDTFDVIIAGRARVYREEAAEPGRIFAFETNYLDVVNTNYAIIVRKNSTISSLSSLQGKSIGVDPNSGTARSVLMHIILQRNNLDPAQFSIVETSAYSLANSSIDALYVREPELSLALASGNYRILVDEPVAKYVMNPWPMSYFAFSDTFARSRPQAASAFKAAIDEAVAIIRSEPQYAQGVLQKCALENYGVNVTMRPLAQWTSSEADLGVIQRQMDLYWQTGLIPSKITTTTLIVR